MWDVVAEFLHHTAADAGRFIYKVCPDTVWESICEQPFWEGSTDDQRDGFSHFSNAAQLAGALTKHVADIPALTLLTVDPVKPGDLLKWGASRGGDLFPHLYGSMPISAVIRAERLN